MTTLRFILLLDYFLYDDKTSSPIWSENMLNPPVRTDWVSTNKDSEFTRYRINLQTGDISASHFPNQATHSAFIGKNLSWTNVVLQSPFKRLAVFSSSFFSTAITQPPPPPSQEAGGGGKGKTIQRMDINSKIFAVSKLHWNHHVRFNIKHLFLLFVWRYFWPIDGAYFKKIIKKKHVISTKPVQCSVQSQIFLQALFFAGYHKTQNFMLISNPLKKLKNNSCEKSYQRKSNRKWIFFTFITVCKSFPPITFFGWFFAPFSTELNTAWILRFMTPVSNCSRIFIFLMVAYFIFANL